MGNRFIGRAKSTEQIVWVLADQIVDGKNVDALKILNKGSADARYLSKLVLVHDFAKPLPTPFTCQSNRSNVPASPIVLPDPTSTIVPISRLHVQISLRIAAVVAFQDCPTIWVNDRWAEISHVEELKVEKNGAIE